VTRPDWDHREAFDRKASDLSFVSRRDLIQAFVSLTVTLVLMGAVLFLSAGTPQWLHDLLFLAVFLFLT
jgi:hypothetical protein